MNYTKWLAGILEFKTSKPEQIDDLIVFAFNSIDPDAEDIVDLDVNDVQTLIEVLIEALKSETADMEEEVRKDIKDLTLEFMNRSYTTCQNLMDVAVFTLYRAIWYLKDNMVTLIFQESLKIHWELEQRKNGKLSIFDWKEYQSESDYHSMLQDYMELYHSRIVTLTHKLNESIICEHRTLINEITDAIITYSSAIEKCNDLIIGTKPEDLVIDDKDKEAS